MAGVEWTDSKVEAGGVKLHLSRAGKGRPIVVLHHETGTLDRLPFYDALAQHCDVLVPHHPGYSKSQRPDWMRSVRDIAVIYRGLLSELGVHDASLVGLGFGGWIAAEMASMAPADLSSLILVTLPVLSTTMFSTTVPWNLAWRAASENWGSGVYVALGGRVSSLLT